MKLCMLRSLGDHFCDLEISVVCRQNRTWKQLTRHTMKAKTTETPKHKLWPIPDLALGKDKKISK